jgi:uncharacterized protein YqgV (UPF0045/DUF77 family)
MIAIQVSLYPLGREDIDSVLNIFWDALKQENIDYRITPMSTVVWAEDEENLYNTVFNAYKRAREKGPAVMVQTLTTGDRSRIDELIGYLNGS